MFGKTTKPEETKSFNAPIPGKEYHAILNGIECTVKAEGWYSSRTHCATCTCVVNKTMIYIVTSSNGADIPAGNAEVQLISEVKEKENA